MPDFRSEAEFRRYSAEAAEAFSRRYGISHGHWSDAKLSEALRDAGMPALFECPDEPLGIMVTLRPLPVTALERHRQRRENAAHLLGHVIMEHTDDQQRQCASCAWRFAE